MGNYSSQTVDCGDVNRNENSRSRNRQNVSASSSDANAHASVIPDVGQSDSESQVDPLFRFDCLCIDQLQNSIDSNSCESFVARCDSQRSKGNLFGIGMRGSRQKKRCG